MGSAPTLSARASSRFPSGRSLARAFARLPTSLILDDGNLSSRSVSSANLAFLTESKSMSTTIRTRSDRSSRDKSNSSNEEEVSTTTTSNIDLMTPTISTIADTLISSALDELEWSGKHP